MTWVGRGIDWLLDRDGTIIVDQHYPRDPDAVELIDGCAAFLRFAREQGSRLFLVSNQSGIARGLISLSEAHAVHKRTIELLQSHGVDVTDHRYCPHAPEDACACRKPRPGMIQDLARVHSIDLARAVMVGDKPSDILAGMAAGTRTVGLGKSAGLVTPSLSIASWLDMQKKMDPT